MAPRAAYYLSTPIYYVNDSPHIGHAYTSLACDVLARFMRLDGRDVLFLTGTDEHGQKVQKSAVAAGMEPQTFVDRVSERFRALGEVMGYSNDDFIRTTEPRHTRSCQELWRRIADNGHIYLGKYAGWYSVREEAFYAESEVTTGPDGGRVTAADGSPVEWVEEPSYFFRLSAWQEPLLDFYERNPQAVAPESRRNEVISFVAGGLNDLSISRASLNWGIPVPGDPDHSTPGDPDHSPCPATPCPATPCMCGSMRSPTTSAVPAFPTPTATPGAPTGRPTCTWSARTSCAFTRSTGPPS